MSRRLRIVALVILAGGGAHADRVCAQELLDLSAYCTFDGSAEMDDVYIFGSSERFREAVNRVLSVIEFPLELELRSANVTSISAARGADLRYILYNTYFAEGLEEDDWMAWAQLAHAVAHHVHRHSLEWTRERPLEEIEADQLTGSILNRLGIPLTRLQELADSILEHPDRPYPDPALRKSAITEGWTETQARDDDKLAFAGTDEGEDPMPTPPPPPSEDPVPRENSSADAYPMFWPPPQASVQTTVPLPALRSPQGVTLGEIARQIEAALDETGYYERTYYAVPDGFAIVARIEQIHPDGTPLEPPDRWSAEVRPMRRFSLSTYFRALFTASPGHFRIVAFVVTSRPFTQQGEQIGRREAQAWLDGGLNVLPADIAGRPATPRHTCTALVYSFEQPGRDFPVRFVDPSPIPARLHLERAGLWSSLQDGDEN